jgi:hypothetical protein
MLHRSSTKLVLVILLLLAATAVMPQKKHKIKDGQSKRAPVLWEQVDTAKRDLFAGPGGEEMKPDMSSITFVRDEKNGHNKKYRIKDGSGRIWVAKLGQEAQPETAAVRLLWALGYKTEITYLVPTITIPGKGTFQNVRLEARPADTKRKDIWKWRDNPFVGTDELQGLKIMMVFLTNWDLLDLQNKVIHVNGENGKESQYIISDLGATFGSLGNNNIPVFYRIGRKTNDPEAWSKAKFIDGVENGELRLASTGQKSFGLMKGITVGQARWLADRLAPLEDSQLRDAFRAANYSAADIELLTAGSRRRINELANLKEGPHPADK